MIKQYLRETLGKVKLEVTWLSNRLTEPSVSRDISKNKSTVNNTFYQLQWVNIWGRLVSFYMEQATDLSFLCSFICSAFSMGRKNRIILYVLFYIMFTEMIIHLILLGNIQLIGCNNSLLSLLFFEYFVIVLISIQ